MCERLDEMLDIVDQHIGEASDAGVPQEVAGDLGLADAAASPEFETAFERYVTAADRWNLERMKPIVDRIARALDDGDFLRFSEASLAAFAVCDRYFSGVSPAVGPSAAASPTVAMSRPELASAIRDRLEDLIGQRDLPYVVTQAEFQEAEGVASENLPEGTWWTVQFDDPLETGLNSPLPFRQLVLYKPLELYRDSLAPYFEDMDFVVNYILAFRDAQQTVFQIDPFVMRGYILGETDTKHFADQIVITTVG